VEGNFRRIATEKSRARQPKKARHQHHERDYQEADLEVPAIGDSSNQRRRDRVSESVHDKNRDRKGGRLNLGFGYVCDRGVRRADIEEKEKDRQEAKDPSERKWRVKHRKSRGER
jgi:hypothetical protein